MDYLHHQKLQNHHLHQQEDYFIHSFLLEFDLRQRFIL
jgi:hypothetical protein